ncbi:hypothetical protein D3C76_1809320 [compost metagenome]
MTAQGGTLIDVRRDLRIRGRDQATVAATEVFAHTHAYGIRLCQDFPRHLP